MYTFSAPAGQQVLIDRLPGTGLNCFNPDLSVTLKAPNGTSVFSNHVMSSCSSDPAVQTLTQAGTYTLTVSGYADNYGPYKFFLEAVGFGGAPSSGGVDLISVESVIACEDNTKSGIQWGTTYFDYPVDPDAIGLAAGSSCALQDPDEQWSRAWIEYEVDTPVWVDIIVWDHSRASVIAEHTEFRDPAAYNWQPFWDASGWSPASQCTPVLGGASSICADAYSVYAYYWDGTDWILDDQAQEWLNADYDIAPDGEDHWYWSPNKYDRPKIGSSSDPEFQGSDWLVLTQRFMWFDNTWSQSTAGSERLARLVNWTDGPGAKFQVEFRRDSEGWDAGESSFVGSLCVIDWYPGYSNVPNASIADSEEAGCLGNEEAELTTESVDDLVAVSAIDPSDAWDDAYYYGQTFFRRPTQQWLPFELSTAFELVEGWLPDMDFDKVFTTQREELY